MTEQEVLQLSDRDIRLETSGGNTTKVVADKGGRRFSPWLVVIPSDDTVALIELWQRKGVLSGVERRLAVGRAAYVGFIENRPTLVIEQDLAVWREESHV